MTYWIQEAKYGIRDRLLATATVTAQVRNRIYPEQLAEMMDRLGNHPVFPLVSFGVREARNGIVYKEGDLRVWCWDTNNYEWIYENVFVPVRDALNRERIEEGSTSLVITPTGGAQEAPYDETVKARAIYAVWTLQATADQH